MDEMELKKIDDKAKLELTQMREAKDEKWD